MSSHIEPKVLAARERSTRSGSTRASNTVSTSRRLRRSGLMTLSRVGRRSFVETFGSRTAPACRPGTAAGETGQHGSDDGQDEHVRGSHRADLLDGRPDQTDDDEREFAARDQRGTGTHLAWPAHPFTARGELSGQHLGPRRDNRKRERGGQHRDQFAGIDRQADGEEEDRREEIAQRAQAPCGPGRPTRR